MEILRCKKCGKAIEGYTKRHVEFLMKQHNLTHDRANKEVKKNGNTK